jgi:hypothetical protein
MSLDDCWKYLYASFEFAYEVESSLIRRDFVGEMIYCLIFYLIWFVSSPTFCLFEFKMVFHLFRLDEQVSSA